MSLSRECHEVEVTPNSEFSVTFGASLVEIVLNLLGMTSRIWRELKPNQKFGRKRSLLIGYGNVMSLVGGLVLTKNFTSDLYLGPVLSSFHT